MNTIIITEKGRKYRPFLLYENLYTGNYKRKNVMLRGNMRSLQIKQELFCEKYADYIDFNEDICYNILNKFMKRGIRYGHQRKN